MRYREFFRLELEPCKLGELMQLLAKLNCDPEHHGSRDVFGEMYEYFLGQFALKEGARAGEFYTPKSVVNLLVEILAPSMGAQYARTHSPVRRRDAPGCSSPFRR